MTKRKWTSGPWGVEVNEDYMEADVYDSDGDLFATLYSSLTVKETASLIAAAPELYEAVERLMPMAEDDVFQYGGRIDEDEDILFAIAALAKARGETP